MYNRLVKETINKIVVEDQVEEENPIRVLQPQQVEKFIQIFNNLTKDRLYPHLKFTIKYKNGESLEVFTEGKRAKIGDELYFLHPALINEEYPFVKIANYHEKINIQFRLLEMKLNNPTKRWLAHFVLINDGYIFTTEGLIKADEAFNQFIMNLIHDIDNGLKKEKAYSYVKELYSFFNKLDRDGLIEIATEDREDICGYVEEVLRAIGLFDKELNDESFSWRNW